jgi:hypothetical protein
LLTRAGAMSARCNGLARPVLPGSKNTAKGHSGVPGNLGGPAVSTVIVRLGIRNINSPEPTAARLWPLGANQAQGWYRLGEGNEAGGDERQGVGASRSTDEAGELDRRAPRREGDAVSENRWRETWRVRRNPWTCPRNDNG